HGESGVLPADLGDTFRRSPHRSSGHDPAGYRRLSGPDHRNRVSQPFATRTRWHHRALQRARNPVEEYRGAGRPRGLIVMHLPFIVTLTLNPAVDMSGEIEKLVPEHKLRCLNERRDPGGGGINVARVLQRLGADPLAVFPVGGVTGGRLEKL